MPGSDVLDLLDREWEGYRNSRAARASLRRWKVSDPSFDRIDDLDGVVGTARGPRRDGCD